MHSLDFPLLSWAIGVAIKHPKGIETFNDGENFVMTKAVRNSELVEVNLEADERRMLAQGTLQWTGAPSVENDLLARTMGFSGVESQHRVAGNLVDKLNAGESVFSKADWTRLIFATELCFASDVSAGFQWSVITGISDSDGIQLLRQLQTKLAPFRCDLTEIQL